MRDVAAATRARTNDRNASLDRAPGARFPAPSLRRLRPRQAGRFKTQRVGSAAHLNIHLHCLVRDGVYQRTDGEPVFVEVPAPSDEVLRASLDKIIARLIKLLARRGVLIEEGEGSGYLGDSDCDSDEARAVRPLQAAACTYRIAFGPRAGQKVFTVQAAMPRDITFTDALCADVQGSAFTRRRAALKMTARHLGNCAAASRARSRRAGASLEAVGAGGAPGARGGHRRVGAHRNRVRLHARPAGAHQLGPAAQTGIPDRP